MIDRIPGFAAWLLAGKQTSDAVAIVDHGAEVSYRQLCARVARWATVIAAHAEPHRRTQPPAPIELAAPPVLIVAENSAAQIAAYLGALAAGAIVAPLPPLTDPQLAGVIRETGAQLVLAERAQLPRLTGLGVAHPIAIDAERSDAGDAIAADQAAAQIAARDVAPAAPAVVFYTSGSTGQPRGVRVSTANLCANASALLAALPLTAADRALVTLPFYYCYGASVLHTHLRAGAGVVLGRLEAPEDLLDLLAASRATGLPGVPSLFQLLLARSSLARRPLPALRYTMISGGRLPDATLTQLQAALPRVAHHVRYGVTELTAAASLLPPGRLADKRGSIGRGLPGAPLRVERADGTPVAPGSSEVGEIVVAGDHVTLGYLGDPEVTARCFRDGAFHTGDLATVDADGFVFIAGRDREFVKSAGHRFAPQEIEDVIAQLPEVEEVAAYGAPHRLRGEAVIALIVVRPGAALTAPAIAQHCQAQLPAYKRPVEYRFVAALPRTASGKLRRRELAQVTPRAG